MQNSHGAALGLITQCRRDRADVLDLGRLGLTRVPDEIGGLTHLSRLHLNDNSLTHLPSAIGRLTKLTTLHLERNRLRSLPQEIGQLTRLKFLYLAENQLTTLPTAMGGLTRLSALDLAGNPLTNPPPEIISGGFATILSFLASQAGGTDSQWTSKILLVGQGRAGKTSLLRALRGESFDRHQDSTHGLEVSRLPLPHPSPPAGHGAVTMQLTTWDFGGQDIYHATHQFFLTDRSLFLLLWDAQVGWQESKLYYWLDLIKARAPLAPVILVATHLDPRPADLPLTSIQAEYPGIIVASMSADSATGEGIDAVRERIAQEAARLPLMGVGWPRNWLEAAEEVRGRSERYVKPSDMYAFMAARGVTEPTQQRELAHALHSLGDILLYSDDEELKDLVVLHPQWLTAYISRVLDSRLVRENDGVFTADHRRALWSDLDTALHQHFIGMMERFDLSYRTTDHTSSLVVELLPWDPPPYGPIWQAAQQTHRREIKLRYRLHTVPPGIPTWFIAREHRFTTGLHWRSGALLRDSDGVHLGLVTVDRHNKTAEITACGPYPHDFFAVLKNGFEQTLRRYPGLEVTRSVPCPGTMPNGDQCTHEFPQEQLLHRLSLPTPRDVVECPVHLQDLDVRTLLLGIDPPALERMTELAASIQQRVSALDVTVATRVSALERSNDDLLVELRRARVQQAAIAADQQRNFLDSLRQRNSQEAALCPGILSLSRVRRRRLFVIPVHYLRLHLYCEAPGAWHRVPGVDPYEIRDTPEVERRVVPHMIRVLNVLRYAVPLIGPVLGVAAADLGDLLKNDIELMQAVLDKIPESAADSTTLLPRDASGTLIRANPLLHGDSHASYRALYTLLKDLDPAEHWAGLNKVTTPEGDTYWLCKQHAQPYTGRSATRRMDTFLLPGQQLASHHPRSPQLGGP